MSKILVGLDDSAVETCAHDMVLAKEIASTLTNHYAGWAWAVNVDGRNGVANIQNLMLHGQMGYVLKLVNIYSASDFKRDVIKAGGEILERFGANRGRFDENKYLQLRTNSIGDFVFDR
jgi:hypothetical protein